jgi:hypothetical protein
MLRKAVAIVGFALICGVSLFGLSQGAGLTMTNRWSWREPPIYPAAQAVDVQVLNQNRGSGFILSKVITYSTDDPPDEVWAFYDHAFVGSGWKIASWSQSKPNSWESPRSFQISSSTGRMSPTIYKIDVTMKQAAISGTDVRIEVSMFPGY